MKILRRVSELLEFVAGARNRNASIGFVPTMGALHAGHLSLVKKAVEENEVSIVSLFVNPAQFNDPRDLESYPRNEEEDLKLLAKENVSAVFVPTVEEMYPDNVKGDEKIFDLGEVAEVMEGKYRPGHFQGVARILYRLFNLINPNRAYFGEKDFQQIAVVRRLVESENLRVDIVACPIKRDSNGLALSSRNTLLSPQQRLIAPEIYKTLKYSVEYSKNHSVRSTIDTVVERLDSIPEMKVEYFEIVDARTLQAIEEWDESPWVVGCITVKCGDIRLIDNITYKIPD